MIQRRLAWPLRKDDTQIREAFHIFQCMAKPIQYCKVKKNKKVKKLKKITQKWKIIDHSLMKSNSF